jgi:DNA-binding response OmpR family regulator
LELAARTGIGDDRSALTVVTKSAGPLKDRPTLLMVGHGEPMDAALRQAFDRHGLFVEESGATDARLAVQMTEPSLVLLVGDAANDAGRTVLDALSRDAATKAVPVALLAEDEGTLDKRVLAFRYGAVAAVPRTASADEIARRVAKLARELPDRPDAAAAQLGEATLDELVSLVTRELRTGILSVARQGDAPTRIVLGAGRPVADAVQEFVQRMRPLVTSAEPLVYEFHVDDPGGVGLVAEGANSFEASIYQGLRVLLVDHDPSRADALAQELRARGATVAISDTSGRGLERARGLDPEVVLMDSALSDTSRSDFVRLLKEDIRLQWASVLVTPWDELWTDPNAPDAERLRDKVAGLVVGDRELRGFAQDEAPFEMSLETTGPCRLLRVLAETKGPHHLVVRGTSASVDMDLAEGLLVGVVGQSADGSAIEGVLALSTVLRMGSASVRIERRANPSTANVMMPVEEALARAVRELSSEATASKPDSDVSSAVSSATALKRQPFPHARELGRARGALPEGGARNAERELGQARVQPSPRARGAADDLHWDFGAQPSSPTASAPKPKEAEKPSATSAPSTPPSKLPDGVLSGSSSNSVPRPAPPEAMMPRPRMIPGLVRASAKSAAGWPAVRSPLELAQSRERRATFEMAPHVPAPTPTTPESKVEPPARPIPPSAGVIPAAPQNRPAAPAKPFGRNVPKRTLAGVLVPPTASKASNQPEPELPSLNLDSFEIQHEPSRPSVEVAKAAQAASELEKRTELDLDLISSLPPDALEPSFDIAPPRNPMQVPASAAQDRRDASEASAETLLDFETESILAEKPSPDARALAKGAGSNKKAEKSDDVVAWTPAGLGGVPVQDKPELAPALQLDALPKPAEPASRVLPSNQVSSQVSARDSRPTPTPVFVELPKKFDFVRGLGFVLVFVAGSAVIAVASFAAYQRFGTNATNIEEGPGPAPGASEASPRMDEGEQAEPENVGSQPTDDLEVAHDEALDLAEDGEGDVEATPQSSAELSAGEHVEGVEAAEPDNAELENAEIEIAEIKITEAESAETESTETEIAEAASSDGETEAAPAVGDGQESVDELLSRARQSPPPAAEVLYRRVLSLEPANHYAMIGLAELLLQRGDAAAARPLVEDAVRRRARRAAYRVLLGDVRQALGDQAGANEAWEAALELEPSNRLALRRLGR